MNILQHSQQQNYLSVKDLKKTLSQNRIKELNNFIEFREIVPNEISDFLETNVNLVSLIEFSIPIIKNFFPQNKLIAEILSPPESDNADQRIVIYIRTNLSVKETLERIKEIDKKCGEYVYDSSGRKLLIMGIENSIKETKFTLVSRKSEISFGTISRNSMKLLSSLILFCECVFLRSFTLR